MYFGGSLVWFQVPGCWLFVLAGSDSEHRVASTANHWHLGNARNRTRRSELVAWNTLVATSVAGDKYPISMKVYGMFFAKQALGIYGSQIFHKRCWDELNTKCGNMYIYVYIHPCTHPCMHACIHTYIHVCLKHVCVYITSLSHTSCRWTSFPLWLQEVHRSYALPSLPKDGDDPRGRGEW